MNQRRKSALSRSKGSVAALLAALSLFLMAGMASAHVTVWPKEVAQNSYEVFTVRVPSEKKDVLTTAVAVRVPEGVNITRTQPQPGWKTELERSADGKIERITWTAEEGQGLAVENFTEFKLSGKVEADATELKWKAYQTYSDSSVVEWIGAPDADYPGPVTAVGAGEAESDGHGHGAAEASPAPSSAPDASAAPEASAAPAASDAPAVDQPLAPAAEKDSLPLILSIIALALGVVAVIAAFTRRGGSKG
ncbi:YcnI family protein [Paenibacillus sp. B01]|uniref:YcnI family copper-binding membrane protein n=1 Tax=Paenibacillus sp. B01 TaxID=2660554 RepID=UPI0018917D48|nr:YcnI family protein [Paenibacillus sp. B01]